MAIQQWMSFEGGVDLCGFTQPGLAMPNVLVHVARMVHTPVGSAPSGMILWQPDPAAAPALIGFISSDEKVARYFGPNIFRGTPFEQAPALLAKIEVTIEAAAVSARITVGARRFETRLTGLGALALVQRASAAMTPFTQQGLEAAATAATLVVDGKPVAVSLPPVGISGGAAAVFAPAGLYAR